jgi:hypothetical protein
MNCFRILRPVIEQAIQQICITSQIEPAAALARVVQHLQNNSAQWRTDDPQINYQDPLCRVAYLYSQVPANANLCEIAVRQDPDVNGFVRARIAETRELRICALGGGPGTELLGLCCWVDDQRPGGDSVVRLRFTVVDGVVEWAESMDALVAQTQARFLEKYGDYADWPALPNHLFVPVDLTDLNSFTNMPQLFGSQDLYVLNYLASELLPHQQEFRDVASWIVQRAPAGAKFLFIDRNEHSGRVAEWVAGVMNGLPVIASAPQHTCTNMNGDEQTADIGPICDQLGWGPRVTWDAFWQVFTRA